MTPAKVATIAFIVCFIAVFGPLAVYYLTQAP